MSNRGYLLSLLACLSAACAASDGCGSGSRRAHELPSASSVRWLEPLEVVQGRAYAGPWQMNDSVFDYVDDGAVALSDAG
ncbi:MAG TPA: hypothetical protein VEX18_20625, partial [Polyangiaceae bacterium]|nr:hypothetical protein [Polyangiaceae bacterium]